MTCRSTVCKKDGEVGSSCANGRAVRTASSIPVGCEQSLRRVQVRLSTRSELHPRASHRPMDQRAHAGHLRSCAVREDPMIRFSTRPCDRCANAHTRGPLEHRPILAYSGDEAACFE